MMPKKTEPKLTWRETCYREHHAFNATGRLVGVIEWAREQDDWDASFAWVCPYKQLGTYNSEARARQAVADEYARMVKRKKPDAPND
jgi:hypothetical protein